MRGCTRKIIWRRVARGERPLTRLASRGTLSHKGRGEASACTAYDARTCQNLSVRRAFSGVILAKWFCALARSAGRIVPVA